MSAGDIGAWLERRDASPDAKLPTLDLAVGFCVGSIENSGDKTSSAGVTSGGAAGDGAPKSERSFCL